MSRGFPLPAQKLQEAKARRCWSVRELAEKSGLGIATVSRALSGQPVAMETLRKLGATFVKYPPLPEAGAVLGTSVEATHAMPRPPATDRRRLNAQRGDGGRG